MGRVTCNTLDGLASLIGFSEALIIAAHYGGRKLSVPCAVRNDSVLANLIGIDALSVLVNEYAGTKIKIPSTAVYKHHRDMVVVVDGFKKNKTARAMANDIGCSVSKVHLLIKEARVIGLVRGP